MTLEIKIDKENTTAGIAIKTAEGLDVQWQDLNSEDQVVIINTLYGFTNLFQKAYMQIYMPELAEDNQQNTEVEKSTSEEQSES